MAYDPNAWYQFTDKDGNTFTSRGDNGYVWQSITEGIPISVDEKGNWYTEPYLDVGQNGYIAHIPNWFKETKEYEDWQTYASQIPNLSVNKTVYDNLNNILKTLGSQGALRTSLTQDIKSYDAKGILGKEQIDKYIKDIVSMAAEGQGGDNAKITLWGTEYNSAADVARHYKELSKESLSKAMTSMYDIMDKGAKGEWNDKPEYLADAITAAKILNYIDDNHIAYGSDDEFNGLLSSSVWQQINRGLTQFMGGVSSNTFVGIPARVAYGAMNAGTGKDFSLKIEDLYNERLATGSDLGAGLEGNEPADVVGMWGGAIGSIAVTMATSMMMGSAINGKVAASAPGGFLNKVGTFAQTIPGAAVSDFFLNDIPLDLMIYTTDTMRDGADKAWFDPENPQPLFGIPFIRQGQDGNFYPSGFGPDVPGGLAMNMVGDAVLDAAIPFLGIVGNSVYKNLDNLTNGGITRIREKVGLLNLQVQEKLKDTPVVGTAWQKFVNYMMGPENAKFIAEARKAAIAEGSMEPYVRAQNLLTLSNHSGMEVVQPLYKQLDNELGISKSLKEFNAKANTYGGVGETRVEWKEVKKGKVIEKYKAVPDTIPVQVKQGLLDVERLSELKGEQQNEGGLIPNAARNKEIAEIEARLEKTPQEIKDFAEKFSQLNRRVEEMGEELGLTTREWLDALQADPRWENYMTRQALTVGGETVAGGTNPPDAKILTAKRKGYYSENYIDPTLALGMKVEALGRAFAWNERAKAMVGFEISQGKVIAGKAGVDVAARLAEVKQQIKQSVEYRKSIGYDDTLGRINKDVTSVSDAFKNVNDLLDLPGKISLKSVYEATQNPAIKEFISDFNSGKIKFAEGVKESVGLSDSEAANIIQNTYVQKGGETRTVLETKQDIKTFDDLVAGLDNMLSVQKIGDTYKQYQNRAWSEEGANFLFDMKNEAGETDFGLYGVSEWGREKIVDDIDQKINAAEKAFRESGQWQEYASWVNTLGDKKLALRDAERNLVNNNKSKTALEDYETKLADYEDWYSKRPIEDVTEIDSVARLFAIREQLYMGYPMINTESFVDSKPVISFYGDGKYKEGGFQNLTRGEVRRALYEDGYDNITNKEFKKAIDKADNSFTQRTTQPMVVYRGETADTARTLKVGDKVDSASWTYTAFTPKYTDLYREGITNKKPSGRKPAYDNKGVIFRYHLKEGSPVYVPHKDMMGDWYNQGVNKFKIPTATQEFVLPRNIDGTIVSITKDARLFSDGSEGNYVTVVDVVVDPNTGVTPKLRPQQPQKIGDSAYPARATNADYPGWAVDARNDDNAYLLRMLDESDPNATREGSLRDYYRDWKGKELAVLEMSPEKYIDEIGRYGRFKDGEDIREWYSDEPQTVQYKKQFEEGDRAPIPYIRFGADGEVEGQEGRHRTIAAAQAGIAKAPVIIEYPKGTHPAILDKYTDVTERFVIREQTPIADANIPDTATSPVRTKLQEKAAAAGYSAGVTSEGIPYRYTVENGEITSIEKLDSNEDYALATSMLGGVYSMTASTVDRIGKINAAAINRTILYYRDNMPNIGTGPTFFFDGRSGSWGYIWPATATSEYGWHLEDGKIVAERYPVFLGHSYRAGNESAALKKKVEETLDGFKPKNTGTLESTPTHESGHSLMMQLAVHRLNRQAEEGLIKLPEDPFAIGRMVEDAYDDLHALLIDRAMKKLGYEKYSEADVTREAHTISEYASSTNYGVDYAGRWKHDEIFSEAQRMYQGNGDKSTPFCLAIIEEMKAESERFATAAIPEEVFVKNRLTPPKGLFGEDGQYNFPNKLKAQKTTTKTEIVISNPLLGQNKVTPFRKKMYHGSGKTRAQIYVGAKVPVLGEGKYWAFDETGASNFGKNIESKNLSLKNVLEISSDEDWRQLTKAAGWQYPNPLGLDEATVKGYTDDLKNLVTKSGYDGILVRVGNSKDGLLRDVFSIDQVVDYGVKLETKKTTVEKTDSTNSAKAEWLNQYRQNNPYIKGKGLMSEEDYRLANIWDTFFQKEIRAYDPNSKSAMPDGLVKKNGDFIEDLTKNAAKKIIKEIRQASVEGFSQQLVTMILSRNSNDVSKAMDEFIVGRINRAADDIAAKMPNGATEENILKARVTLWSDSSVKNEFIAMLSSLSPDIDGKNINSRLTELFDTQAKGYASAEALPIDTKKLLGEQEHLTEKLYKENNYARRKGKEVDESLTDFHGDVTQVVHYKEGGEDVYVVVSDPVIADVLKKPYNYKETGMTVEAIASAANFISRSYRLGTTGANPIAFVRNVLRDPLQATIQGGFNPLNMSLSPEVFYHTLRGFGLDDATISNVTQRLRTWASSGTMTAEMRNMGIDTPATLGYRNKVEKVSKKLRNPNSKLTKAIEKAEAPLETWESMFRNQIAQQSFVKNYQRTKDVNRAMGAALFDASNSTTNFSHSVGLFGRATSTIPYLSSAINGTRSFWVQFNVDPIGMITRITAGFMVPAMAITAWNLSSQERREAYMNLPEWYKQGHLVLIDLEGNTIAFPIPEELEQYYGTARKLMEFTQEATPYGIGQIMSQGAFGFLPVDMDGFYGDDGSIQVGRGVAQLVSGILPQAATAIYEFVTEKDLFTGQDLSDYTAFQKWINAGTNVLGTGFKNLVNDVGYLLGAPKEFRLGKTTADTLARDLFGVGFDTVKSEFMNLVGNPSEVDPETGKEKAATGLFAENEKLQKQIEGINAQIAYSSEDKKAELESQKQTLITNFTERVTNLVNKYMNLYTQTGGLEEWQKDKIVKLLTLGRSSSSADSGTYQSASTSDAYLNERSLAQQRYVGAGLPAGPSLESMADDGSIELQAAINRFYGVNKQATQDFKNVVEATGMKDVKEEFYSVMQKIYDAADEQNKQPDYDLIERIQARYLQMMDAALIPLINEYGVGVLNNNDFIDAVRKQVAGMIPSDDWRQSVRNAKKFLSTKDFPTATVDVKKWLKTRYTSGMRNRNLKSDPEVTERINSIKDDIDAGRLGSAAGKIEDLKTGISKANFYISSQDLMILNQLNNMVK